MHRTCRAAVRITAGSIVPRTSRTSREPDVESVEKNALRIIWIHNDSLIVPVLGIVACAVLAISQRAALRTPHEGPTCASVSRSPSANLAAGSTSAAAVAVTDNRLCLGVDVIRVTRRDGNLHPAQLIARIDVNKRRPAACIHRRTSRIRAAGNCSTKNKPISVAGN